MSRDHKTNIGEKIKTCRLAAHVSQMALAEKMGISYQQLQKYEKGINNISVYRLGQICECLKMPPSAFLEGPENEKIAEDISQYGLDKDERALLGLFRSIENKNIRRGLILALKGIVEEVKNKRS